MVRKLLITLTLWLAAASSFAADAIRFGYDPAATLYVRVWSSSSASIAAALTEGTSGAVGRYIVADSTLVSGGLSSAGVYSYKVFVGSPSTTANDVCVGVGTLYWTGSAAITEANYLLYGTTSDTGASTWGRALHYLRTAWVSAGVYSEAALENGPAGAGGGIDVDDADLIAARIVAARGNYYPPRALVWQLERTAAGVEVKNDFEISKGEDETIKVWIDFAGLLGRNEAVQAINSLTVSGGPTEVASSEGITGNLVYVSIEGGTADDVCEVAFDVTTTEDQQITGTVILNVAD